MSPTPDLATLRQVRKISTLKIDLFTVFSTFDMDKLRKIRQHHWKERLNIGKPAEFENDTCQASEDIAPQSCETLQMFV